MLVIASVSLIIYVEEELGGGVGGWSWDSRIHLIWVHNWLANDSSSKVKYPRNKRFSLTKTKH